MKIESVQWKPYAASKGIDPTKAYESIEAIRRKHDGQLTDDAVIEAAKPKSHVLHKWFEWDDSEAAQGYRRLQARNLIRSFKVTYAEAPEVPVRAYQVHRKEPRGGESRTVYRTTEDVLSDDEARDRLIAEAVRMAMEFRRRFKGLHELSRIIETIDETIPALVEST